MTAGIRNVDLNIVRPMQDLCVLLVWR